MNLNRIVLISAILWGHFSLAGDKVPSGESQNPSECTNVLQFPGSRSALVSQLIDDISEVEHEQDSNVLQFIVNKPTPVEANESFLLPDGTSISREDLVMAIGEKFDLYAGLSANLVLAVKTMIMYDYDYRGSSLDADGVELRSIGILNRALKIGVEQILKHLSLLLMNPEALEIAGDEAETLQGRLDSIAERLSYVLYVSGDQRFPKPTAYLENGTLRSSIPVMDSSDIDNEFEVPAMVAEREAGYDEFWASLKSSIDSGFSSSSALNTLLGFQFLDYDQEIKKGRKQKKAINQKLTEGLKAYRHLMNKIAKDLLHAGETLIETSDVNLRQEEATAVLGFIYRAILIFQTDEPNHNMARFLTIEKAIHQSLFALTRGTFESIFKDFPSAELREMKARIMEKFDLEDPAISRQW